MTGFSKTEGILQLRLLVGFLGERAQFGWWPTSFYEQSSRLFLEPVFSKTSQLAQYHGVLEAARRLHDEHLSVGSYHLFRLPEELEQDIHALMQSPNGENLTTRSPQTKEDALRAMAVMAPNAAKLAEGPKLIGGIDDIDSTNAIQLFAAAYLSAFQQNLKTYPYLVA
jgi:hypothetical protein